MHFVNTRNVHQALPMALLLLRDVGVERVSRNGPVLVSPEPVTTRYSHPEERVMFWEARDANPFLHFHESMWMLGGRNDIATLVRFTKRMAQFSDDGITHHGAYGHRWRIGMPAALALGVREHDQLTNIARALLSDHSDRRQVLQMWDARSDLSHEGKDVPCNVTATFQVSGDKLCMTVFNRSNDIVWGCYGANAVHFSYLLEYMARRIGVPSGSYHQVSVNWHGYRQTYDPLVEKMEKEMATLQHSPYESGQVAPYPLMQTEPDQWDRDLRKYLATNGRAPMAHFADPFFNDVAVPILQAYDQMKDGEGEARFENALKCLRVCRATDWQMACSEWINRRWNKFRKDADDGPAA